ncbi:hypothetical protein PIB30_027648 [Stylosanthes scabra]|uniref:Cytochrome P450 n=1 Tax=Stylosanthes scabra TaxID=79078 RepID=A0ABU6RAY3_9FABA|nr:hypothetical protein [Stylosanthes scabra]
MSRYVAAKAWGKPNVFRKDRYSMFGEGLVMTESDQWVLHRHVIAPAFNPLKLKGMGNMMVESTKKMIERWNYQINYGNHEIDVEREIMETAGEIIAKASFGMEDDENGKIVFRKLKELQMVLFKSHRFVGVPFGNFFAIKKTLEAKKIGQEVDKLLISIINDRMMKSGKSHQEDLLGHLLQENNNGEEKGKFSMRGLVDECKTFFFGGYETTSLSITWSLLLLAMHEDWQNQLRDEIKQVMGNGDFDVDVNMLNSLKKMKWVMNEAVRLYPPSPNVQRQAKEDIRVDNFTVPKGTNIWIDLIAMHRDAALWGTDANEFKPERFKEDANGGCNHQMGYLPFGFGGRMCVGRNLSFMEYKIVLTLLLSRFRFKVSSCYQHSPAIMLSLRPTHGLPLIVQPL